MAELVHVGKHCTVTTCKQLDFLPIVCNGCSQIFCKDHYSVDAHNCSQENFSKDGCTITSTDPTSYECTHPDCTNRELIPILCEHCNKHFCLSHRHQQEHSCVMLKEKEVPMAKTAELVKQITASHQAKGNVKKGIGKKSAKTAAKVALMKMKMHAVGDKGIPQVERIYFSVVLPRGCCSEKNKAIFFSSNWSIGRCVDKVAEVMRLKNDNNIANAKKLRLFHPDTGESLAMDAKLASLLSGDVPLYSGGFVILEYVDNGCVVLDNVQDYL
ncbi:AN1-type zinc finger protein 1-like [Amphiura filiformis]|uniref:AN1-type zinc finger protein 1-like n=1 Tax=Amphiura filiformis TaxID=82378 RepID=UPI003B21D7B8